MKKTFRLLLCPLVLAAAIGCASPYKDALGRLSRVGRSVAEKYEKYLAAEPDSMRRDANQAELDEFKKALDEAARAAGQ